MILSNKISFNKQIVVLWIGLGVLGKAMATHCEKVISYAFPKVESLVCPQATEQGADECEEHCEFDTFINWMLRERNTTPECKRCFSINWWSLLTCWGLQWPWSCKAQVKAGAESALKSCPYVVCDPQPYPNRMGWSRSHGGHEHSAMAASRAWWARCSRESPGAYEQAVDAIRFEPRSGNGWADLRKDLD